MSGDPLIGALLQGFASLLADFSDAPLCWALRPLTHGLAAAALALAADWLGTRAWRRSVNAHWAEQARLLWPARVTCAANVYAVPILLGLLQRRVAWPCAGHWLLDGLVAAIGVVAASYWFDRQLHPETTFAQWRRQVAIGWSLRLAMAAVLAGTATTMPTEIGWPMAALALAFLTLCIAVLAGAMIPLLGWWGRATAR